MLSLVGSGIFYDLVGYLISLMSPVHFFCISLQVVIFAHERGWHDEIIRSDHKALQWLLHNHTGLSRLGRWALSLQGYSFTVIHIAGTLNNAADYFQETS